MKRVLIVLLLLTLCVGIATAETCVRFIACVDGSDTVKVDNSQLSITHGNYQAIGAHQDCPVENQNVINVGGTNYPINLVGSSYKIAGQDYLPTSIISLHSFNLISPLSRGILTLSTHELLINDDGPSGPAVYSIDLCGDPTSTPTPEFPSVFLPTAMIIGFLGAVLLIQRTREH